MYKLKTYLLIKFTLFPLILFSQNSLDNLSIEQIRALSKLSTDEIRNLMEKESPELIKQNLEVHNDSINYDESNKVNDLISTVAIDSNDIEEVPQKNIPKKERFGVSFFSNPISQYIKTDNIPVSDSYILGPGDELQIQLTGTESQLLSSEINRDGKIFISKIGEISLSGLKLSEAKTLIHELVSTSLFGTKAIITMGNLKSVNVFITGEVINPGLYNINSMSTISQAIFRAGGITEIGSIRNINVFLSGNLVHTFDAYKLLLEGSNSDDLLVTTNMVINVPTFKDIVETVGEFNRNMYFEILPGETVADLVRMAGGFSKDALPSGSVLTRRANDSNIPNLTNINLYDINDLSKNLNNGDKFRVPSLGNLEKNYVSIIGNIVRDGKIGWNPGMRVSDVFKNNDDNFNKATDLNYSLIARTKTNGIIEFIDFSIEGSLNFPGSKFDPVLKDEDRLLFFSNNYNDRQEILTEFISKLINQSTPEFKRRIITIEGAVRFPGSYPLSKDATISTLLNAAGGLLDTSFTEAAELVSLPADTNSDSFASLKTVNLSSPEDLSIALQPLDHVNVRFNGIWSTNSSININGEVRYPGVYRILEGDSFKSIIERAGGLTSDSFIEGAIFTRQITSDYHSEISNNYIDKLKTQHSASFMTQESNKFGTLNEFKDLIDYLRNFNPKGRLVIETKDLLNDSLNIRFMDGDSLFIPKNPNSIIVIGEVKHPNVITYKENISIHDLISLSGGLTPRADKDNMFILKADGSIELIEYRVFGLGKTRAKINSGDSLIIPIDIEYQDDIDAWKDSIQILYQSLVSLAAVKGL